MIRFDRPMHVQTVTYLHTYIPSVFHSQIHILEGESTKYYNMYKCIKYPQQY